MYRKQIYKSYSIYQEKCASELRSLSKADPKAFWATLNKYSNTKKVNADIPVDIFFEYFRNLNSAEEDAIDVDIESFCENPLYDEILNGEITDSELLDALTQLKNNKSPGFDKIVNEYLKNSPPCLISIYCKLFNIVLRSGIIPENWTIGIIKPVYKNKGTTDNLDNYRAITLISCLGKLFTCILNNRLTFFANENDLISQNQA